MHQRSPRRAPRAGVDPIDRAETALDVIDLAAHAIPVDETIVILLDHLRRGLCIAVVSGTTGPDDVIDVVELFAETAAASGRIGALVVASVRPDTGLLHDDADRWLEMSAVVAGHGLELLEWFVLGLDDTACPRDLFGEPPRW